MSITSFPSTNTASDLSIFVHTAAPAQSRDRVIRRRPTMSQGQALEMIGHAIEYVYDSRVYRNNGQLSESDSEAVSILMRLSRDVFQQCQEVAPASGSGSRLGFPQRIFNLLTGKRAA